MNEAEPIVRKRGGQVKHGFHSMKEHVAWRAMIRRCTKIDDPAYPNYGGRGITVCERWMVFLNFLADIGRCPDGMSLERKNNSLGYCPENCCWADCYQQNGNKRNCVYLTVHGKTMNVASWARVVGAKANTIYARIKRGLPDEEAIFRGVRVYVHTRAR